MKNNINASKGAESRLEKFSPLISVVMPTFNREMFLREAIQSVLDQTFRDFELIIIDDGSTDGTKDVVNSFPDHRIHYIYQSNRGRSNARNHALHIARGRYIAFLDSDDLYLPDKLQLQVDFLNMHPEFSMVYTSAYCMDETGALLHDSYAATVSGDIYQEIAFYVPVTITLPTVMVSREVFEKVGGFDEKMDRFEDTDMWRRIAKEVLVGAMPEYTCLLRTHSGNALARQDPIVVYRSVISYIDKVFIEDASISLEVRSNGAADLCFYYARALLTLPHGTTAGRKLLFKSIGYKPKKTYRLAYLVYYFFLRIYKDFRHFTSLDKGK